MRNEEFRNREINKELKSLSLDFMNKYDNIFVVHQDSWSMEKKEKEFEELIRWFNDKEEDIADRQFYLMTGEEVKRNE